MNFRRGRSREEPEINLIPMIDVLLVILIFLMVTTSYAKFSELQINLPQAGGEGSSKTGRLRAHHIFHAEPATISCEPLYIQFSGVWRRRVLAHSSSINVI